MIVRIDYPLSPDPEPLPATIYRVNKRGKPIHVRKQYLTPETRAALGNDLTGKFMAEMVDGVYFIDERIKERA